MAKAILFNNYTDEDFTHNFDSEPWTFKAGESTRLQEGIARMMAKHLVDREMTKDKMPLSDGSRKNYLAKILIEDNVIEEDSDVKLETAMLNEQTKETEETDNKWICEICGFEAKTKAGLTAHMRKHNTDDEKFEGLE